MLKVRTRRPSIAVERLEARLAMSQGGPAGTLGVAVGVVPAPRAVAHVASTVAPRNLSAHRKTTVIGLSASPQGGGLEPAIVASRGPDGTRLPLTHQRHSVTGVPGEVTTFTRVGVPGLFTSGVTGRRGTTGPFQLTTYLPGDINGDGTVDLADLQDLAQSYLSKSGGKNYNPAADLNRDGVIDMSDAKLLGRNLPRPSLEGPLFLDLTLAPGDLVKHPGTFNSGAITHRVDFTIVGRTIPGALVFADSSNGYYRFDGPLLPTDAQGNFSYSTHFDTSPHATSNRFIASTSFLVIDPFGRQLVRNFPILRI